jgi:biopolymer transport protein ExbD
MRTHHAGRNYRKTRPILQLHPQLPLAFACCVSFTIIAMVAAHGGELNSPNGAVAPNLQNDVNTKAITVTKEGKLFFGNNQVTLSELREQLIQQKTLTPDLGIVLRGDADARYQNIMDVMDLCGQLGITRVGLGTKQPAK